MKSEKFAMLILIITGMASVITGFYLVDKQKNDTPVSSGGPLTGGVCGDGAIQKQNENRIDEECDSGENNGIECTTVYGKNCSYCDALCQQVTKFGPYCGDGKIEKGKEECDDANFINGDGCTNKCKKERGISTSTTVDCVALDMNNNLKIDLSEYTDVIKKNGKKCVPSSATFNICGGQDSNKDGKIDSKDLTSAQMKIQEGC